MTPATHRGERVEGPHLFSGGTRMAKKNTKRFRLKRRTETLELTGEYEGGEIVVAVDAPISFVFRMGDISGGMPLSDQLDLVREFGDTVIQSWNLEDADGVEIPADAEGAISLPFPVALAIIETWSKYVMGTDRNLAEPSSEPDTSV